MRVSHGACGGGGTDATVVYDVPSGAAISSDRL
jgi:hypothetical protein